MKEKEWDDKEDLICISFINQNTFIEKMKISILAEQIDIYTNVKEYAGQIFSHASAMKKIFRYNDEQIKENLQEIEKESKDPMFAKLYATDEDDY